MYQTNTARTLANRTLKEVRPVHTQTVLAETPRAATHDPLFRKRARFERRAMLKLIKCVQPTSGVNHKFTDTEKGSTATLEVIQNAGSKSCYFFEIDYIAPPKSKRQKPPPNWQRERS